MSFITEIEAKIAELAAQIKTHLGYVSDITNTIDKLSVDKATSANNVHILNGATQAYTDVLNALKAAEANPVAKVIEGVVEAAVPEAAPIVQAVESIIEGV